MAKTEQEKKERKAKREKAKAERRKQRKGKGKVRRLACGLVIRFLENTTPPGKPGKQFPGRYYGARKRRRKPQDGGPLRTAIRRAA